MSGKITYLFFVLFLLSAHPQGIHAEDNPKNNDSGESGNFMQDNFDDHDTGGAEKYFSLKVQFKNQFACYKTDNFSKTDKEKNLISNLDRIRLTPELNLPFNTFIHVDYDNELITGNYLKSYEFDQMWHGTDYNDLLKTSKERYTEQYLYRTKIHNAYAKIMLNNLTLTLGRQQIRYGSGRLWNPLDIMNPISPISMEGAQDQKGTDAIRAEYYPTPTTEISLVYDQKRRNNELDDLVIQNSNIIGRLRMSLSDTEIAVLGGQASRRNVCGSDISLILFDGTLRGAAIYNRPRDKKFGKPFIQAGVGYEYNFSFGLYFLCEYFYNQNALNSRSNTNNAYMNSQTSGMNDRIYYTLSNQIISFHKHYSGMVLGYNITPLLRIEEFAIYDYQGKGIFLYPELKYNVSDNVDISLGCMKAYLPEESNGRSDFELVKKYPLVFTSMICVF